MCLKRTTLAAEVIPGLEALRAEDAISDLAGLVLHLKGLRNLVMGAAYLRPSCGAEGPNRERLLQRSEDEEGDVEPELEEGCGLCGRCA